MFLHAGWPSPTAFFGAFGGEQGPTHRFTISRRGIWPSRYRSPSVTPTSLAKRFSNGETGPKDNCYGAGVVFQEDGDEGLAIMTGTVSALKRSLKPQSKSWNHQTGGAGQTLLNVFLRACVKKGIARCKSLDTAQENAHGTAQGGISCYICLVMNH